MQNLLFILSNVEAAKEATSWYSGINWTATAVIVAAIPIVFVLCKMLINLGRFNQKFEDLTNSVEKMDNTITANSFRLNAIKTFLYANTDAEQGLFEHNSPIQLTVKGIEVLERSGGKKYLDNNINSLIIEIEEQKYDSAFDVQNFSSIVLFQRAETEDFKLIKNWVYNNPVYKEVNITLVSVINVMAVHLRNVYLEKHPDLLETEEDNQS
jgi:hypothetical protein